MVTTTLYRIHIFQLTFLPISFNSTCISSNLKKGNRKSEAFLLPQTVRNLLKFIRHLRVNRSQLLKIKKSCTFSNAPTETAVFQLEFVDESVIFPKDHIFKIHYGMTDFLGTMAPSSNAVLCSIS